MAHLDNPQSPPLAAQRKHACAVTTYRWGRVYQEWGLGGLAPATVASSSPSPATKNLAHNKGDEDGEEEKPGWSELPPELLELVFAHLDFGSLVSASRVCRGWHAVMWERIDLLQPAHNSQLTDNALATLLSRRNPVVLNLRASRRLTKAGFECISALGTRIRSLGLLLFRDLEPQIACAVLAHLPQQISALDLTSTSVGHAGIAALHAGLQESAQQQRWALQSLCLVECLFAGSGFRPLCDNGTEALALFLADPRCQLTELRLDLNMITDRGLRALCAAEGLLRLKTLSLCKNQLTDLGVNFFFQTLLSAPGRGSCVQLEELHLAGLGVSLGALDSGPEGGEELSAHGGARIEFADVLVAGGPGIRGIRTLDLSDNYIGLEATSELARAISRPDCSVQSLNLSSNSMLDEASWALIAALELNCSIKWLDLENGILDKEMQIARILRKNTTLATLFLARNALSNRVVSAILDALGTNTALTALHIDNAQQRR